MPDRKCVSAVGSGSLRPGSALSGVTISIDLRVKNMKKLLFKTDI
jgi:hypothetical protein